VLAWVLDRYLRLLHPVVPHITEEIWDRLPHDAADPELLMVAPWPVTEDGAGTAPTPADAAQARAVDGILELIRGIRNARAETGIEAVAVLDAEILFGDPAAAAAFPAIAGAVERLARVRARVHPDRAAFEAASGDGALAVVTSDAEARLARGGADLAREQARLRKELDEARSMLAAAEAKLANPAFVQRAPGAVVEAARNRAAELGDLVDRLAARLAS
jgi:valyl-tRNA synthetase